MKKIKSISLRFYLPVFVIGSFVILLAISALFRSWFEISEAEQNVSEQIKFDIATEANRIEHLLRSPSPELIAEEIVQFGRSPDVDLFLLVDSLAFVIYANQQAMVGNPLNIIETGFDEDQIRLAKDESRLQMGFDHKRNFLLAYQPVSLPNGQGFLLLKYSLTNTKAMVRRNILNDLLISFAVAMVLVVALIVSLRRWFSQPLSALQKMVIRIGQGDFTSIMPICGSGELAELGNAIAQMQQARIKALSTLGTSESMLRNVVDGFGPSVFVGLLNLEGHVLLANQAALTAAGICLEDVLNVPVEETYWFAYSPTAKKQMRDAVQLAVAGTPSRFDILIRGPGDNAFFWIDLSIQPVFDLSGSVSYLVPSALVIQERKLAEEKLRLSEESLAITLHSIGDAVIATDTEGKITRMNAAAEHLTGWLLTDAMSAPLTEVFRIISADTRSPSVNPVQRVMEQGEVVGLANHTVLLARDGKEYQIADSAAPIRNEAGHIVGVVLVFSDVTEKYNMERDLRDAEQRFREAFELIPCPVTLQTTEGVLIDCSKAFCEETGFTREEALNHNIADLNLWVDPEQRNSMRSALLQSWHVDDFEFQMRCRDGQIKAMNISARMLLHKSPPILLSVANNITARKQVEDQLIVALQEKTALLKEVHHRVKNNLQVITSLLSLEAGRSSNLATATVLKEMKGRIRSMALLHETLYRSGVFAVVELDQYLEQLATQTVRTMDTSTITISLQFDMAPVHLEMDQALPCGLLVNELVSNSLKHGFPNGGKGEIKLELKLTDGLIRLTVRDTGVGLPSDFTMEKHTSLGLQLVSDLAAQLGGNLLIDAGPGAVFTVSFTPKNSLTIA